MTYHSVLPKGEPYASYATFHEFFDLMELPNWLADLQRIYHYSLESKVCSYSSPAQLLFAVDKLHLLIEAAYRLNQNERFLGIAILMPPINLVPDMTLVKSYVHQFHGSNIWSDFPRFLTPKQYYNPFKAIKKFCKLESEEYWHEHLDEITHACLSKQPMFDLDNINLFKLSNAIFKLIEACHLIDLRISKPKNFIVEFSN